MSAADEQLLSQVLDLEKVADLYNPQLVDPIKYECFDRSKYGFFMDNLGDYAALWLRWGFRNPGDYLKAWIEQTKGYWNAGYWRGMYVIGGEYAPLGITRQIYVNPAASFFDGLFKWLQEPTIFWVFQCIGVHVWILIGCMAVNVLKNRKAYLIGIPAFVIIAGLWLCTPVYAHPRYAYAVFLTVPFILSATAFQKE